jgi:hypothetical protein
MTEYLSQLHAKCMRTYDISTPADAMIIPIYYTITNKVYLRKGFLDFSETISFGDTYTKFLAESAQRENERSTQNP